MAEVQLDRKGLITACPSCGQRNRIGYSRLDAPAHGSGQTHLRCGKCRVMITPPGEPIDVRDAATFDAAIAQTDIPVVVDFWAPWCGPCRVVAPELAKVAAAHPGEYLILKVNTDAVPELGDRYKIRSIPTMAVFAGAREIARESGARPAAGIEAFIESTLARR